MILAHDFGLHKIDSNVDQAFRSLTEEEQEECRHLWWSVSELDGFCGWATSRAFLTDPREAESFLPSSQCKESITCDHAKKRKFPSDLSQACKDVRRSQSESETRLLALAFYRTVYSRLSELDAKDENAALHILSLEDHLSAFRLALPVERRGSTIPSTLAPQSLLSQRMNAETLLVINMSVFLNKFF